MSILEANKIYSSGTHSYDNWLFSQFYRVGWTLKPYSLSILDPLKTGSVYISVSVKYCRKVAYRSVSWYNRPTVHCCSPLLYWINKSATCIHALIHSRLCDRQHLPCCLSPYTACIEVRNNSNCVASVTSLFLQNTATQSRMWNTSHSPAAKRSAFPWSDVQQIPKTHC